MTQHDRHDNQYTGEPGRYGEDPERVGWFEATDGDDGDY